MMKIRTTNHPTMLAIWILLVCANYWMFVHAVTRLDSQGQPRTYLIRSRSAASGDGVEVHSPYVLWENTVNTASPKTFQRPLDIFPTQGLIDITLTVELARISTDAVDFTTRVFCYYSTCRYPGPTLHVRPGDRLRIKLVNKLENTPGKRLSGWPQSSLGGSNNSSTNGTTATVNSIPVGESDDLFYPNRTNIVIHGIPLSLQDNSIYRYTQGNNDFIQYDYVIPNRTTISPGVASYSSHVHRLSSFQMMSGLHGMIFILPEASDEANDYPSTFTDLQRHNVVLSHLFMQSPVSITNGSDISKRMRVKTLTDVPSGKYSFVDSTEGKEEELSSSWSLEYLSKLHGSQVAINPVYTRNVSDMWLVNGYYQPQLRVYPNEWRVLDIYIASGDRIVELAMKSTIGYIETTGVTPTYCDMILMARSGIYFTKTREIVKSITLLQSERVSIAFRCPSVGYFYFQTIADIEEPASSKVLGVTGSDIQLVSNQVLMTIKVSGKAVVMSAPPTDLSFIRRPSAINIPPAISSATNKVVVSVSTAQPKGKIPSTYLSCPNSSATPPLPWITDPAGGDHANQFLIGLGSNCRLPCYDETLCSALYGAEDYSLLSFPTVKNGGCTYATSVMNQVGSKDPSVTNFASCVEPHNGSHTNSIPPGFYEVSYTLSEIENVNTMVWGHADFPYAVTIPNHWLQLLHYQVINDSTANILIRDDYSPSYDYTTDILDSSTTATTTGSVSGSASKLTDWQDVWPSLKGITTLRMSRLFHTITPSTAGGPGAAKDGVLYPLTTPFLKYEDHGFIRFLRFYEIEQRETNTSVPITQPTVTPTSSPVPTTPMTGDETKPKDSDIIDSDSAQERYQCDVLGRSFYYQEEIDIARQVRILRTASCPNHFSTCQHAECGGTQAKTRALQFSTKKSTYEIPLYPRLAQLPLQDLTCMNAETVLGLALNGVGFHPVSEYTNDGNTYFQEFPMYHATKYECLEFTGLYGVTDSERQIERESNPTQYYADYNRVTYGRTPCSVHPHFANGIKYCGNVMNVTDTPLVLRVSNRIDKCGGFADHEGGRYVYHSLPICLLVQLTSEARAANAANNAASTDGISSAATISSLLQRGHSVQIGWSMDGFPIYGPQTVKGIRMLPCGHADAHPQLCLDACYGYYGALPGVDEYLYRYYIPTTQRIASLTESYADSTKIIPTDSGNNATVKHSIPCSKQVVNGGKCDRLTNQCCTSEVPDSSFFPYVMGCYRGCKLNDSSCTSTEERGFTSNFIPQIANYAKTIFVSEEEVRFQAKDEEQLAAMATAALNSTASLESVNSDEEIMTTTGSVMPTSDRRVLTRNATSNGHNLYTIFRQFQQDQESTANAAQEIAALEYFPSSNIDGFITGMTIDEENEMLYFTTGSGIYSYNEKTYEVTPIIKQDILYIDIYGNNFGNTLADVVYIKVKNQFCTSVLHISSEHLRCVSHLPNVNRAESSYDLDTMLEGSSLNGKISPTASDTSLVRVRDIEVRTISGVVRGIALNAEIIVRSEFLRPVITDVVFRHQRIAPLSIVYIPPVTLSSASTGSNTLNVDKIINNVFQTTSQKKKTNTLITPGTLYWTSLSPSLAAVDVTGTTTSSSTASTTGFVLQRCLTDGTQLETVLENVQLGVHLEGLVALFDEKLNYYDQETLSSMVSEKPKVCDGMRYLTQSPTLTADELAALRYGTTTGTNSSSSSNASSVECLAVGHMIWLADKQEQVLLRLNLWPIQSSQSLFYPASLYETPLPSNTDIYRNVIHYQDKGETAGIGFVTTVFGIHSNHHSHNSEYAVTSTVMSQDGNSSIVTAQSSFPLTVMLHNVTKIQSFTFDLNSSFLFMTVEEGMLFRVDLDVLLASSPPSSSGSQWPVALTVLEWFFMSSATVKNALPSWISIPLKTNKESRFRGVAVIPLSEDDRLPYRNRWNNQRILVIDTNREQFIAVNEDSLRVTSLDIGNTFGAVWPHQVKLRRKFHTNNSNGDLEEVVELYVSEYLGKIWKLKISKDSTGKLLLPSMPAPHQIVDFSGFTFSTSMRKELTPVRSAGYRARDAIFFEAST